jgi:hypothetical protein
MKLADQIFYSSTKYDPEVVKADPYLYNEGHSRVQSKLL